MFQFITNTDIYPLFMTLICLNEEAVAYLNFDTCGISAENGEGKHRKVAN